MKTKALTRTMLLAALILTSAAMARPDGNFEGRGRGPQRGPQGFGGGPGYGMHGGFGSERMLDRMADKLDLTDAQQQAIKAIMEDAKESMKDHAEKVRSAMKALHEAAEAGSQAEIIAAGKAAGDALTEQALAKAKTIDKIKAELTDEQLVKFEDMKAEMKEKMEQMRQDRQQDPDQDRKERRGQRQGKGQGRGRGNTEQD